MQNDNGDNALTALLNDLVLNATSNTPRQTTGITTTGAVSNSGAGSSTNTLEQELQRLTGEVALLRQVNELNQQLLNENTNALAQAATKQSGSSKSGAASTAKSIGSFLLGGLGIGPLISGIASLFGGDDQPAPPPLVKYSLPSALQYDGAVTGNGQVSNYDYNDRGGIRTLDQVHAAQTSQTSPQVVVQVNAMDSKSFLDHRDEIAQAVRAAILNSSSLNDVISEM